MPPPPLEDNDDCDIIRNLHWDHRYSFHMEGDYSPDSSCVAWIDDDGMLCYMEGSTLHKYDTRMMAATMKRTMMMTMRRAREKSTMRRRRMLFCNGSNKSICR
jgi:hypothetical protein